MTWYNFNLPLVRRGEVEDFETRTCHTSKRDSRKNKKIAYKTFTAVLKDVEIIRRPEWLNVSDNLLNVVNGTGEPPIEKYDKIGILSWVSASGDSFEDSIVRKLKFNKNEESSYEVLATYHL